MKVYILVQNSFSEEGTSSEIIQVFYNKEKAIQTRQVLVIDNIMNYDFVKDEQNKSDKDKTITLFRNYQENWNNYIELKIVESEVE